MLIKGSPDILSPPSNPLGYSGLDAVPRSDAGTTSNLRTQFVQQYGQAALDRILSVWQSNAPDWVIVSQLRAINQPDVYKAAGVQFEDFYAWWSIATAQESVLQTFSNAAATRAQRAQTIRFVIANTPGFTTEQAAAAVGMSNVDFVAWLEGSDAEYANTAKAIVTAPLSDPQKAQMLESLAYKMGLSVSDLARYLGQTTAQVSALLSKAGAAPTYVGGGLVAQATSTQPGAVLLGSSLAFIPAKSSRVIDALPTADGRGSVVVTTIDGVTAEIAPGIEGLRTVPITPQAWGRLEALQSSTALDYQAQSIAIYRALKEIGVTDPDEMDSWIPAGLDTVLAWLEVAGQTKVPTIEEIGIQAPSFSQDVALNAQFSAIFNDASLTREQKAAAWVSLMRANGFGLNDVSRIVGVDARAVSEFLSSTDLAISAEVPKLITVQTDSFVDFQTPETLFVQTYTRQAVPTGSGGEIPILPDLAAMDSAGKAAEYLRLLDLGWTDAQIRLAVEIEYGAQLDADWQALRNIAAAQRAAQIAEKAAADAAAAAAAAQAQADQVAQNDPQSSAAAVTAQQADNAATAAATANSAAAVAANAANTAAAAADAGDAAGSVQASQVAQTAADTATNAADAATTSATSTGVTTTATTPVAQPAAGGVAPLLLAVAAAYILGA